MTMYYIYSTTSITLYLVGCSREFIPEWSTQKENAMWFDNEESFKILNCIRLLEKELKPERGIV